MTNLDNRLDVEGLQAHPSLAEPACKLSYWALVGDDAGGFLREALRFWSETLGSEFIAMVRGIKGQWRTIAASGPQRTIPAELLSEALDGDRVVTRGDWYISPISGGPTGDE